MSFELHKQLATDTFSLMDYELSSVLLMNDKRYPWVILVPRVADIKDIHELNSEEQKRLMEEISLASKALMKIFKPEKINVAALGNIVPQLHVHVIARQLDDETWPSPVWGIGQAKPYSLEEQEELKIKLVTVLSQEGTY